MKIIWSRMRRVLKENLLSLLAYELIFRIGTWLAVIPLVSWLLGLCMKICGYRYVTNQNIFQFLGHPLTLLLLLITLGVVLYLSVVEYAGLLVAFEYSAHGVKIAPTEMLLEGMEMARRSWHRLGIFLLVLLVLPITNFLMIGLAVYKVQALNYIAERILVVKASLYILETVVILLYLLSSQALLPMVSMYLSIDNGKEGARFHFRSLIRKRFWKNLRYFTAWNLIGGLMLLSVAFAMAVAAAIMLITMTSKDLLLVQTIRYAERIVIVIGLLAGMVGTVINLAGAFTVYHLRLESQLGSLELKRRFTNQKELLQPKKKQITLTIMTLLACVEIAMVSFSLARGNLNVGDYLAGISVTAHRGASQLAPENTLASLQAAIDIGADYAEIDVQESKDGVLFLMHDTLLTRTCNRALVASELTYDELRKMDAGSFFSKEFALERIPTLEEALELCRGRINLNIEIKENPNTPNVIEKTIRMIEDMDYVDRCVVTCTNQDYLKKVKEINPDIKTGMILKIAIGEVYELEGVDFFSAKYTNVSEEFVKKAHEAGLEVHVWTVNNDDIVRQMAGYQVDNIITDRPVQTREVLQEETYGSGFITILRKVLAQLER